MAGTTPPHPHPHPASPPRQTSAEPAGGTVEVTRSEERARVATETIVTGRAVLRKYVVTETVTQTFQVRHEEVLVDYELVPAAAAAVEAVTTAGVAFDGRAVEIILYREEPVVQMRVVPAERVVLHVDTVTEQVAVSTDLRHEQLDVTSTDK